MRLGRVVGFAVAIFCAGTLGAMAQPTPAKPEVAPTTPPVVAAPKAGVYSQQSTGSGRYRLIVTGKKFTSREAIEKYLAYRAADLALQQRSTWFTFVENRSKRDTAPTPVAEPGKHFSFRMAYWRPVWRYKTADAPNWTTWSPFSSQPFFADGKDPKAITEFEVSADIVLGKGLMNDQNPLAFEPRALSEFLVNQVSPPE